MRRATLDRGPVRSCLHGCIVHIVLNPIVLLSLSLSIGGIGLFLLLSVPQDTRRATTLEQARSLGAAPPGADAVVEGRLSEENRPIYGRLVAFVREEYRSNGETSSWVVTERRTPTLLVDELEQTSRIANDNYELGTTAHTVEIAPATTFKGAVRAQGYAVDDRVVVLGTARSPTEIDAAVVYVGTRAQVIADLRDDARAITIWGSAMIVLALLWAAIGIWRWMLFLRETRESQTSTDRR